MAKTIFAARRRTRLAPLVVYTIGHSNRELPDFIELLIAHKIKRLVDVRTIPRSRKNPQFNGEALRDSLTAVKISYSSLKELGGLRRPLKNSQNTAWRNSSFRGYADYMQGKEFGLALEKLLRLAEKKVSAIMCAEALPWRCHRSLIADALVARKVEVRHILSKTGAREHKLTVFAKRRGERVWYPPPVERSARKNRKS